MNTTMKVSLIALVVILVLLGLLTMLQMNKEATQVGSNNSADISATIEKDLDAINQDQFSDDFKDIDKDISGL